MNPNAIFREITKTSEKAEEFDRIINERKFLPFEFPADELRSC